MRSVSVIRKKVSGNVATNTVNQNAGGLDIDGTRIPTEDQYVINTWDQGAQPFGGGAGKPFTSRTETGGRWPANLIRTGGDVIVRFPITASEAPSGHKKSAGYQGGWGNGISVMGFGDQGSAARFFYAVKRIKG